tara:strand:+ start:8476 stop:9126 length:651 start_codon:yes stop_codon:yes gene_type:complete
MKIQNIHDPFPLIVIDDHYNEEQLDLIWKEIDYFTHPSRMISSEASDQKLDDSAKDPDTGKTLKNNYVVWLDDMFQDREHSNILRNVVVDPKILINHGHWYFNCRTVEKYYTQLLYYQNGNEYRPHFDVSVYTSLTWLYKEPKAFTGGDLIFPEFDMKIELEYNRTIVFPGPLLHQATPIDMEGSELNGLGRYCISQFFIPKDNTRINNTMHGRVK